MKQLIYYIKLTDGIEIISITRSDAVERINNHYKNENYYEAITLSVFDRLITNGKSTSYIEIANKTPINEYYKTEVDLFILNDKKQRTDDAMKKAINRYVNKLYHANHIVRSEIEDVNNNNEILLLKNECDNEIIEDAIKTTEVIKDDVKTHNIIDDEIKTDNITDNITDNEIKTINMLICEDDNEINETEEEMRTDILKSLTDYLIGNAEDETTIDITDIKNYYENNKEEVEMLFMNNNMGILMSDDKPKKKPKHKLIKQKIKTLRNRQNKQNKTFKR
tara:strand:+ start:309 stop:1145 length:837 start_codon:yes stop_codon:yes gene_type:complete